MADFYVMDPIGQHMMYALMFGNDFHQRLRNPELPKPQKDASWMAQCRDPTWNYSPQQEQDLYFANRVKNDPTDHFGENETLEAILPPFNMHRGALAPKWVIEATPKKLPDNLETYQQRLICTLAGRFVCITRQGANEQETLQHTNGRPREGTKYSWRFWDNDGNVYEDELVKCRNTIQWEKGGDKDDLEELPQSFGLLPGDFTANKQTWMREGSSYRTGYFGEDEVYGPYYTNTSEFWDNMWHLKYEGTTLVPLWDGCLVKLAQLAGVPVTEFSNHWHFEEQVLDKIAISRGWRMLNAHPATASYYNDSIRLNFHFSTGTVEALQDRSGHGRTQLYRRKVRDVTAVFGNPRQDPDGVIGQKRKPKEEVGRTCAQCGQTKSTDCFSKNQRRKGLSARCKTCV